MVLIDTSVWVDHFRRSSSELEELLLGDEVLIHPFVIGELACGQLKPRKEVLRLFNRLPHANLASWEEALFFLEHHKLYGTGLGYVDVHLLVAAKLSAANIWSLDKVLVQQAKTMKIDWS